MIKKGKAKKMKSAVRAVALPDTTLGDGAPPPGIEIVSVLLRQLHYEELSEVPPAAADLDVGKLNFTLGGSLSVKPPYILQIGMKVEVISHSAPQLVGVTVLMTATFRRAPGVDAATFMEFVRLRSGPLLFPYVREVVSAVTARGVAGPSYLNPLVLTPMMTQEESLEYIEQLSQHA